MTFTSGTFAAGLAAAFLLGSQVDAVRERIGLAIAVGGVTIVVAYALFRFVEHPLERRIRRGGTATPQSEVALAR